MTLDDEKMLSLLAPEYRAYIERPGAEAYPSLSELSVTDARKLMRDMQQADVSRYPVTVERHSLDGFSVLILKPASLGTPLPVVAYFHGGGVGTR